MSTCLGEVWYCSDQCLKGEETDDHVLQHSLALVWHGLQHLATRDAVREGDGEDMLSAWKMDLITFWNEHHPKYLILGHLLLASEYNGEYSLFIHNMATCVAI